MACATPPSPVIGQAKKGCRCNLILHKMSDSVLSLLRDVAAAEFNHLLTEAPFRINGELDFGWYCREHAFCTLVVSALLGMECRIMSGDILISVKGNKRLSSIGTDSGHSWCISKTTAPIDFSLHFREFGDGPQLVQPIVSLGQNGIFDVRFLPAEISPEAVFDTSIIGYIPRQQFEWTATELVHEPTRLLPTREAAEISARVALHTFRVLSGEQVSLVATLDQAHALAHLRAMYPEPLNDLNKLLAGQGIP
jgi:hypothetical protein